MRQVQRKPGGLSLAQHVLLLGPLFYTISRCDIELFLWALPVLSTAWPPAAALVSQPLFML